jgi:polyribonucleotide nucleotidyltransferase
MATVCSGILALLDAGIKITKPVSGIAMGLISREDGKYAVLSDILGDEDHLGDMDFKVTGTADGITACQMDLKVDGLSYEVLEQAMLQAKRGRLHILGEMLKEMSEVREDYKPFVPRIKRFEVPNEFIGAIIGTGGKVIQGIQKETGTVVSIEEVGKVGMVEIASPDADKMALAYNWIMSIITEPEVNATYDGKVKSIQPFGAIVEFAPGKEGLLHISEIKYERLADMDGIYEEGQIVKVKLIEIDPRTGKYRLSAKALLDKPEGYVERERPSANRDRDSRGGGGGFRGRDDSRGRDDRGPRRDDRGGRDDRGPRNDDRGPRRDDRGPRNDDRGPRRDDDRGPRPEPAQREDNGNRDN